MQIKKPERYQYATRSKHQFSTLVSQRQNDICNALSAVDDTLFKDSWDRPGGGGITRILESPTFEKAGVNTSQVFGAISKTEIPMFTTLINKVAPHISNLNNSDFLPQELVCTTQKTPMFQQFMPIIVTLNAIPQRIPFGGWAGVQT